MMYTKGQNVRKDSVWSASIATFYVATPKKNLFADKFARIFLI